MSFEISENTITRNGLGGSDQRAGSDLFGDNSVVSLNRIVENSGNWHQCRLERHSEAQTFHVRRHRERIDAEPVWRTIQGIDIDLDYIVNQRPRRFQTSTSTGQPLQGLDADGDGVLAAVSRRLLSDGTHSGRS